MPTTRKRAVPLGVPAMLGVAGFAVVAALGPQAWQLVVSAVLGAALVVADLQRYLRGLQPICESAVEAGKSTSGG